MAAIGQDIGQAAALLTAGELVAIPTETVYGLAANALDPEAVLKIFAAKQRPRFNPLIVHTSSLEQAKEWVVDFPPLAHTLAKQFWPGPLTLLLPKSEQVHDLVTAGSPRVAVRVPRHELTLELLRSVPFPVAAPSANPFGYISPTQAAHVNEQLGEAIPYILDGGPTAVGVESTIVGFEADGHPSLYRLGGIAKEELEAITGPLTMAHTPSSQPQSPGQLASHYAPRTEFVVGVPQVELEGREANAVGVLAFAEPVEGVPLQQQEVLSPSGDLAEAARHLFAAMRRLDALGLQTIIATPFPQKGLGLAINDRLQRAAVKG